MTQVLVTGAQGFIGKNLVARLGLLKDLSLTLIDVEHSESDWTAALQQADIIFHLAGVNRPQHIEEFETGNADLVEWMCGRLRGMGRAPKIVMSSSIQAALDNPYGISKRKGEEALRKFAAETGAPVSIFRLKNVFGKWCRPNYNSVTATFCHNIAHDMPITISNPDAAIELVYVDEVVEAFLNELHDLTVSAENISTGLLQSNSITLGALANLIYLFHDMRNSMVVPDFSVRFNQCLYTTYLSYREPDQQSYVLDIKADPRGSLAEFLKSEHFGQIFVSRTHPGITRGNHYHHTKTEKFFVLEGDALIRMRPLEGAEVTEYRVQGNAYTVINIPPGYTHSITNVGSGELVALFWASEIFDPERPDTYFVEV